MSRLSGHALRYEGAPFDYRGKRIWTSRDGRAKCECGALSDVLPSVSARKRWHREHKQQIRDAADITTDGRRP